MNLYDRFEAAFRGAGLAPALICPADGQQDVSYRELLAEVNKTAGALASVGVGPGDAAGEDVGVAGPCSTPSATSAHMLERS